MTSATNAPTRVINTDTSALVKRGRIDFGTYLAPLENTNLIDAHVLGKIPTPKRLRALRLKEWQAFQFGDERYFVTLALFDAKVFALVQVKVFDRISGKKTTYEKQVPSWAMTAPSQLLDSEMSYRSRDCTVTIRNLLRDNRIRIQLDIAESRGQPRIVGALTALTEGCEPQVVCIPFGRNHGMYSHKGLVPVEGSLSVGEHEITFSRESSFLFMDDHKGYYPYVMRWDWVTGAGRDENGRLVGISFTRNDSIDPARFNENCLWVDGKAHLKGPVQFTRRDDEQPPSWQIRDEAGEVDLLFEIVEDGRLMQNLLVLEMRYKGPFGRFSGQVLTNDGEPVRVDSCFGMGEDFYLRI